MDDPHADPDKLSIRCPGCGQRFNVGIDLRDRMVECGTCEHRFRVNDDVVIRSKKFYPGERKGNTLDGFSRMPKSVAPVGHSFQPIQYEDMPAKRVIEPTSPLRLILGFSAVGLAVIVAMMLIGGGSAGGMLYGTSQSKRVMLAVFSAVVCGALLIAANPRARRRAIGGAVFAAIGLITLPFVFTEGTTTAGPVVLGGDYLDPREAEATPEPPGDPETEAVKSRINLTPLTRALEESPDAAGIWLRGLEEYHRLQVRNYIVRVTGASPSSHMYKRTPDYLMVVVGTSGDLDELARICQRFGEVRRTLDSARLIEVAVNNESFLEGPIKKLSDPENPAFYELNRRELESIDLERARRAVVRLASAPPKIYRKDIVRRMLEILREGDVRLQDEIGKALPTWSEEGDGAEDVVRPVVEKIAKARGEEVPESLVKFLVERGDLAVIPIVDEFWAEDASAWEGVYAELGPAIEDSVLARFGDATITLQMSAVRLLEKVGTSKSIPVLEAAREDAIPELRVLVDRALDAIRARR